MSGLDHKVFAEAAEILDGCAKPVLLTHAKADGDAYGALVGMRALLAARGVEAQAVSFDPLPERYSVFGRYPPISVLGRDVDVSDLARADAVIVLDTCTYNQLAPAADWLRDATVPKIAVDHHRTRDELADVFVIDTQAAATCLVLYDWARSLGWSIDDTAAEAIFIGIATDTGWFRHANTDARALGAAAELSKCGVRSNELFQRLYQNDSAARLRLLGVALDSLEFHDDGRVAITTIEADAIDRVGARMSDSEDIINEPLRIATVAVSILAIDQGDGIVRVSFRSKVPLDDTMPDVNVASVAESLGGGGHARASGARIRGSLADVRRRAIEAVREAG